jgi:hypothetical protein
LTNRPSIQPTDPSSVASAASFAAFSSLLFVAIRLSVCLISFFRANGIRSCGVELLAL